MPVNQTWTNPTGATLDLSTGAIVGETNWDALVSNTYHIGGTAGLAFVAFTPTLVQTVSITFTINRAVYAIVGKTAIVHVYLSVTSTGTTASAIQIGSIPAAVAPFTSGGNVADICGVGVVYDASVATYTGTATFLNATTVQIIVSGNTNFLGATPAFILAPTDQVGIQLVYEIA